MTDAEPPDARASAVDELIALGRDREAVVAATRQSGPVSRGGHMDGVQQLDVIIPLLESLVDEISVGQLEQPTPCAKLTVSGVLEHMIGGATAFAPAFRGESPSAASTPPPEGSVTARWRAALSDLLDAVHSPGAQDRTIASPFGEVPGSVFARYVAFDGLVHGWDLASATGGSYGPPAGVVAEVDAFARDLLKPEMRDGDTFDQESVPPAGATALERLVAFSGRAVPFVEGDA